jgi:hypothetical protein
MTQVYELSRDVTPDECHWLQRDYKAGERVYRCNRATYGAIGWRGTACTLSPDGDYPFFELPTDALVALDAT